MAPIALFVLTGGVALLGAVLWPIILRDLVIVNFGLGRQLQPISDFPYECRKIAGPGLEACEDMWLSENTRQLFLACSNSLSRKEWMPNIKRLNASGRSLEDKIVAMSIDVPVGVGYEYRVLETPGFPGVHGDGRMHLVGFTGVDRDDHVELYLVNNKPSVDTTTGEFLNQDEVGANSTIEHFRVYPDVEEVQFMRTFHEPHIITTPNNIATRGDGSFYFTNDHGPHKTGYRHDFSPMIKDGSIGYCNEGGCRQVESGIGFPNGLSFGANGLLYVPSSFSGDVRVYRPKPDGGLEQIEIIPLPYPLDNLSLDADGDLWVPGLPDISRTLAAFSNPLGPSPPASVFRIKKGPDGYQVDKILEDSEGRVLPAATAVVHDVKSGRIFISGVFSPFISVCERKKV